MISARAIPLSPLQRSHWFWCDSSVFLKAKKYIHVYIGEISANHRKQPDPYRKYVGSFKSNRYVMAALCQSPWPKKGTHLWGAWWQHWLGAAPLARGGIGWCGQCSVSAPSLCSRGEFWAPISGAQHQDVPPSQLWLPVEPRVTSSQTEGLPYFRRQMDR